MPLSKVIKSIVLVLSLFLMSLTVSAATDVPLQEVMG